MQARIYLVTNNINRKQYIGQTITCKDKIGHGTAIRHAYKIHGKHNFTYEIIASGIDNRNTLNYLERFWIKSLNTNTPHGYNIENGGSGHSEHRKGIIAWNKGKKTPYNVRLKLSLAKKGRIGIRKGIQHTDLTKLKISLAKKGTIRHKDIIEQVRQKLIGYKHKLVECPHCHKIGGISAMPRWHFNNCKFKEIT